MDRMDRHQAILNTHPSVVTINGDTDALDDNGNVVVLDETLITAEITRLEAEYDSQQYARDRAEAYPSLTDQADMAYWDRKNGTTTLDDAITAVKDAYPKT
jgi:hypothetical protein